MRSKVLRQIIDGVQNKQCTRCHELRPETGDYFYIVGGARLHSWCKPCHKHEQTRRDKIRNAARTAINAAKRAAEKERKERLKQERSKPNRQHVVLPPHPLDIATAGWGQRPKPE